MKGLDENTCGSEPLPPTDEMEVQAPAGSLLAAVTNEGDDDFHIISHPLISDSTSTSSSSSPISYPEAVFSDTEGPTNNVPLSPSPHTSFRCDSHYIKISVSDPQKMSEPSFSLVPGAGTFVSYLITTRTRATDVYGFQQFFAVRRRFRDFVILADRIAESYRGFFIPPRPDKSVVESQVMQKQEFVEQRRSALEKYLCKLAAHPVIGKSDELKIFLEVPGKLPLPATTGLSTSDGAVSGGTGTPQDLVQPSKGGMDFFRVLKELKKSVANEWGGVKTSLIEEDEVFLERKERLLQLEQQLGTASQQAELFVKAQQDISETMGELGLAFIKLGKFEKKEAIYISQMVQAADFKHFATAAVRASRAYREMNLLTVKHLDKLHEYYELMLAVRHAFSDRSSAFMSLQSLLSDLSSLQSKGEKTESVFSKVSGRDRTRIRKLGKLKEKIRIMEDVKSTAFREYEQIKENNRSELGRLDRERLEDFLTMIKGLVLNQTGYAEKIAGIWTQMAGETSRYANISS